MKRKRLLLTFLALALGLNMSPLSTDVKIILAAGGGYLLRFIEGTLEK